MNTATATPLPRERPIVMAGSSIRSIFADKKVQTRRAVKMPDDAGDVVIDDGGTIFGPGPYLKIYRSAPGDGALMHPRLYCPYGYPGDRLWCKETWGLHARGDETDWFRGSLRDCPEDSLRAQYNLVFRADWGPLQEDCLWRPSIFMPRWASRLTLELVEVRVQRLQTISPADACDEGVAELLDSDHPLRAEVYAKHGTWTGDERIDVDGPFAGVVDAFATLWDSINGKRRVREYLESACWEANPLVWALTFKRIP